MVEENITPEKFNIRVYGICIQEAKVLLVHEKMNGFEFTKFPGGGLEFGEGIREGLAREIMEELRLNIDIVEHFFTTDFFQRSAFNSKEQLISIYYKIRLLNCPPMETFPMESQQAEKHRLRFYWKKLDEIRKEDLTFPIDRRVLDLILSS